MGVSCDPWSFGWDQLFALTQAIGVVAGTGIALWSLVKWRHEQVGRRQAELAEDALALMYEGREVINSVRSPGSFDGEGASRRANANEAADLRKLIDFEFIPIERLNAHADFFTRVQKLKPRLRALWGSASVEPLDELLKIRSEIIATAHMLSQLLTSKGSASFERVQKLEAIKWQGYSTPDAIDQRLVSATARLETIVEPVLRSRFRGH